MDEDLAKEVDKWLYCHWDTHEHDVQFGNEAELDKHLYSHYAPTVEPIQDPTRIVECHWDSCHESFDIDQVMEHFHNLHQGKSLKPHHGSCEDPNLQNQNCYLEAKPEYSQQYDSKPPVGLVNSESMQKMLSEAPEAQQVEVQIKQDIPGSPVANQNLTKPFVRLNSICNMEPKVDTASLPVLQPVEPNLGVYQCMWHVNGGICGRQFYTSSELNSHIVHEHTGMTPHICEWNECNRARHPFTQKQKLVRHLQTHAKNCDNKCNTCGKLFSCSSLLNEHNLIHNNEKPFTCEMCGKSFRTRNSFNIHLRVHSGLKPLVCPFPGCGKRFAESSNLAKHRRVHMAPQFSCPTCERRFTRKDHLNRHMKTKMHGQYSNEPVSEVKTERSYDFDPQLQQQLQQPIQSNVTSLAQVDPIRYMG